MANSAAKTAASSDGGSDPVDRAPIATRWSLSATCSPNCAPLRLPQGGDQPNLTTIDNDIASHGTAATTPFGITENHRTIHAELSVRFPPFQLYEFPVMRTCVKRAKTDGRFGGSRTRKTGEAVQPKRLKTYSGFG